jgi:hypothetical protein
VYCCFELACDITDLKAFGRIPFFLQLPLLFLSGALQLPSLEPQEDVAQGGIRTGTSGQGEEEDQDKSGTGRGIGDILITSLEITSLEITSLEITSPDHFFKDHFFGDHFFEDQFFGDHFFGDSR